MAVLSHVLAFALRDSYAFVTVLDLDVHDRLEASKRYSFTGFPGSRIRVNRSVRTLGLAHIEYALDPVPLDDPPTARWHPVLNIAGRFIRDEMRVPCGPRITAPEPLGISGGGVWTKRPDGGYSLVGVGIEWDASNDLLIGVGIGAALALIKKLRPHLELPLDPRLRIRFS